MNALRGYYQSTFFSDGWQDYMHKRPFSPPDVPVYAAEYKEGWEAAEKEEKRRKA